MDKSNMRLIFAILMSILIMHVWQYFLPKNNQSSTTTEPAVNSSNNSHNLNTVIPNAIDELTHVEKANKVKNIEVRNKNILGKISTMGLSLHYIELLQHKENIANKTNVKILQNNSNEIYFTCLSFSQNNSSIKNNIDLPSETTIWHTGDKILSPDNPVTFTWQNKDNLIFNVIFSIDDHYMISVESKITNNSNFNVELTPAYKIIKSEIEKKKKLSFISGPQQDDETQIIGAIQNTLSEQKCKDLLKKDKRFYNSKVSWIGSSNKYWMCSFIPEHQKLHNLDITCRKIDHLNLITTVCQESNMTNIENGSDKSIYTKIFCGPKELNLLDSYKTKYNIELFDRAVNFGLLYFITKPLFQSMKIINSYINNFGVTIIAITLLIRLALLPMLRKSENNMSNMKKIQPKIDALKEKYPNNTPEFRQKLLELYKKENVNPISFSLGCLPILLQMPIFYAFLVVLQIAIDLRHAPFFFWIKDLSAPDNLYILNLFGFIDIALPEFLKIGVLPVLCGISLYLQQKFSPQILDPMQQKVFRFFPVIFTFIFANSPSGLIIYCIANNLLSMAQQIITKSLGKTTKIATR